MGNNNFATIMEHIVRALKEKGYDPYTQLVGYVTKRDSEYITRYKEARRLIEALDMEMVMQYVQNMKRN
ncbi:MAG: IreB family regulatory phosphoprotein [Lachnospiraceae bacterium]|nr:IreB family regulatory phosphoprotein [Lachnospiraceae bacterium]